MARRTRTTRGRALAPALPGRRLPAGLAALVLVGALATGAADVAAADPTPPTTDQDVRDARQAVDDATRSVAQVEIRLAELAAEQDAAEQDVMQAGEAYTQATVDAQAARESAEAAAARAQQAEADAEQARRELVALAREMARSGGSADLIESLLSADGFADVANRTTALDRLTGKADQTVQRYRAAQLVASTMQERADREAADADAAERRASDALVHAQQLADAADDAARAGRVERDELIDQLAAARHTSAEVERDRQDQVDAERRARAEAAARARAEREQQQQEEDDRGSGGSSSGGSHSGGSGGSGSGGSGSGGSGGSGSGGSGSGGSGSGGSGSGGSGSGGSSSGGSGSGGSSSGGSGSGGSSSGGSGSGGSGSGGSGGSGSGGSGPGGSGGSGSGGSGSSSDPYGLGTGRSVASAAQAKAALAWAKTKIGLPYVWGGAGPDGYDCSGLTMMSYRAAGVNINRTSRQQYVGVKKIAYDDMRPGDLVFWTTNPKDPMAIYHVAMWAGNGQIVEAPRPGVPLRLTAMRWANTMPFAGRA
ncbi:NlpC/P60 family protein [Cellulomonas massiliensis]|uniref:C40 family peptidase n=1 Tax=Cellulomonas massiliensis TaxID=1465811 RepID=UPI0003140FF8|nr:C40 family peptidase [Cellulomonas massiliensis]